MVPKTDDLYAQLVSDSRLGVPSLALSLVGELSMESLPFHRWAALVAERALPHTAHFDWSSEQDLALVRREALSTSRAHGAEHALVDLDGALLYVSFRHGRVAGLAAANDPRELDRAEAWLRDRAPEVAPTSAQRVPIEFWTQGRGGPYAVHRTIDVPSWHDIAANYPLEVRTALAALIDDSCRPSRLGRLILWHGVPGTGKTHALRALAWHWREWCVTHYITDPEAFFGSSEYMLDVLTTGEDEDDDGLWRLLVLEDTGELLTSDARARTGQGLSRFLNVVDGLIGQGLRLIVLVTTNESLVSLHDAVARPGRCAALVEFVVFPAAEARAWLAARGYDGDTVGAETLADLYGLLAGVVVKSRVPIGFRIA
jgi:hypothetical protein